MENLLLAATCRRTGRDWRTGSAARDPEVKKFLGFTADQELISFIYIGYPDIGPVARIAPPTKTGRSGWNANGYILDLHPGSRVFQRAVTELSPGSPGGELVVDPDDQAQRSVRGTGRGKDPASVHHKRAAIFQPAQGILVPLGDIQGQADRILTDDPACQAPQEARDRPDRASAGEPAGLAAKQNRWDFERAERPGEETIGGNGRVRTEDRTVPQGKPVRKGSVHEPGGLWQRRQAGGFTAEAEREAERIIPEAKPPGAGQVSL